MQCCTGIQFTRWEKKTVKLWAHISRPSVNYERTGFYLISLNQIYGKEITKELWESAAKRLDESWNIFLHVSLLSLPKSHHILPVCIFVPSKYMPCELYKYVCGSCYWFRLVDGFTLLNPSSCFISQKLKPVIVMRGCWLYVGRRIHIA